MRSHRESTRHSDSYEQSGWHYKHEGEFKKAIQEFDKAIAHHQKTYFALHGKGECLLSLGEYDAALDCFRKAIHKDRNHPWAYHGAGRAYYFLKQYDIALANLNKSISIDKHTKVGWHWKGRTLMRLGRFEEAETALNYALRNAVEDNVSTEHMSRIENDLKKARSLKETAAKEQAKPATIQNITNYNGGIHADNGSIINRANTEGIQATDGSVIQHPSLDTSENETAKKIRKGLFSYICSNCGHPVKKNHPYCTECGRKLT